MEMGNKTLIRGVFLPVLVMGTCQDAGGPWREIFWLLLDRWKNEARDCSNYRLSLSRQICTATRNDVTRNVELLLWSSSLSWFQHGHLRFQSSRYSHIWDSVQRIELFWPTFLRWPVSWDLTHIWPDTHGSYWSLQKRKGQVGRKTGGWRWAGALRNEDKKWMKKERTEDETNQTHM